MVIKDGSIKKFVASGFFALAGAFCNFLITWGFFQSFVVFIIFFFACLLNYESDDNKKTDKGFELFYKNLSNRRKFIRNMWLLPVTLGASMLPWFVPSSFELWRKIIITLILLGLTVISVSYSYAKWKRENKKS
ncbi:hypothetical protein ACW2QC_15215 [Virgibacillus sp. FSP13]